MSKRMPHLQTSPRNQYDRLDRFFSDRDRAAVDRLVHGIHFRSIAKRELLLFGPGGIALFERHGITVQGMAPGARFGDLSRTLKEIGSDGCEDSPHTLAIYVWPDRTLYVKDPQLGVFSHEMAHALDHCLAMEASIDSDAIFAEIKAAYNAKTKPPAIPFQSERDAVTRITIGKSCNAVSPYGGTSLAEGWAEAVRAYCGINDNSGLFATLSSAKLRAINRPLYTHILTMFMQLNGRHFERERRFRC